MGFNIVDFHYGCKNIRFHPGNNWEDKSSFDETVLMSADFVERDLRAPYLDFITVSNPGQLNFDVTIAKGPIVEYLSHYKIELFISGFYSFILSSI